MRPADMPPKVLLERVWPLAIAVAAGVAGLNFLAALIIAVFGHALHPALADSQAWVLFAAAGVAMTMQAVLMRMMYRQLWQRLHQADRLRGEWHGGPRLPLTAALAQPSVRRRLRVARHAGRRRRSGSALVVGEGRSVVM